MYTVKVLTDSGMDKDEVAKKTGLHQYRVGLFLSAANKRGVKRLAGLIEMCLEADEKIKSTPLDSYVVIEKLTIEVCKIKQ
jgi:DNA polymerase-3 subunit delta